MVLNERPAQKSILGSHELHLEQSLKLWKEIEYTTHAMLQSVLTPLDVLFIMNSLGLSCTPFSLYIRRSSFSIVTKVCTMSKI